ncbi:MAG: hypothetical protein RLO12_11920 [Fulvivirga sp.]
MKFLDRIGLAKNIEIPISTSVEVFEQQLLNFKNSNTDKFGFLYSNKFLPSDLKLSGQTFLITKNPRFLWPFTSSGEIKGQLVTKDKHVIESRIFSMYWLLYFIIFMTILMGSVGVFLSSISNKPSTFLWLWLAILLLFNVLTYFMLRINTQHLEKQFREFIKEEIS